MKHILKILAISFIIIIIFFPGAIAETITIESDSMSHGDKSSSETLESGDVVEIISVSNRKDITTYFMGKEKGYKKFGDFGDVIAYYKNGDESSSIVIHRALLWLEYNASGYHLDKIQNNMVRKKGSFDIPELNMFNVSNRIYFDEFGYNKINISINFNLILTNFERFGVIPHSGFLTKGDRNLGCDQISTLTDSFGKSVEPVKLEWIKGKVERPNDINIQIRPFWISIVLIVVGCIIIIFYFKSKKRKKIRDSTNLETRQKNEISRRRNVDNRISPKKPR